MTTPNLGLPFPTLGDVPNVPADIQNLAEAVDTAMSDTGLTGLRIQRGNVVGSADGSGRVTLTFPASFTGTPVVIAQVADPPISAYVATVISASVGPTGFSVQLNKVADASPPSTGNFRIAYIAIGPA